MDIFDPLTNNELTGYELIEMYQFIEYYDRKKPIIAVYLSVGFAITYIYSSDIHLAIDTMTSNKLLKNGIDIKLPDFQWNANEKENVLSAFFYGFVCSQILSCWLASRVSGSRKMMAWSMFVPTVLTLLSPYLAGLGATTFMLTRGVSGLFSGLAFACNTTIWGKWAQREERTWYCGLSLSGFIIGKMIVSIVQCTASQFDWEFYFIIPGIVGLIWTGSWLLMMTSSYLEDEIISNIERIYTKKQFMNFPPETVFQITLKDLLCSKICWANFLLAILISLAYLVFNNKLLEFKDAPIFSSLSIIPNILMLIFLNLSSFCCDYFIMQSKNIPAVRKCMMVLGLLIQASFLLILLIIDHTYVQWVCICCGFAFCAMMASLAIATLFDVSSKYASILIGIETTIAFLSPTILHSYFVPASLWPWTASISIVILFHMPEAIFFLIYGIRDNINKSIRKLDENIFP